MSETQSSEKKSDSEKPLSHLDNLLNQLKSQADELSKNKELVVKTTGYLSSQQRPTSINDKIREEKARKQKIVNDIIEKDQNLKESTLKKLFIFLGIETFIIFSLAFLQGFTWSKFKLDQWSFRLVIAATLGQITAMLTIAVQHLFPKKQH